MRMAPKRLDVTAQLEVTVDGTTIPVTGEGDTLNADLPDLQTGLALWRQTGGILQFTTQAQATLQRADVQLCVRVDHVPVARLGARTSPGFLSRLFGMYPIEILPGNVLKTLF